MRKILKGKASVLRYDTLRKIVIDCKDLETYRKVSDHIMKLRDK